MRRPGGRLTECVSPGGANGHSTPAPCEPRTAQVPHRIAPGSGERGGCPLSATLCNRGAVPTIPLKTGRVQTPLPEGALNGVRAAHPSGPRLIHAQRLSGGVSAEDFRLEIETGGRSPESIVLRIHGDHHNGHPAALEFDILRTAAGLGLCAPRSLALDESRLFLSYPFLLLAHIGGETAFPALPLRDDQLPELFCFLRQDLEFDAQRARLAGMTPGRAADPAILLHGDFWPGNLLWQDEQIAGIPDWEDAARGHPLSDLACAALELRYVAGGEGAESFLRAYGCLRPMAPRPLADLCRRCGPAFHGRLGPAREAHMHATALSVIRKASALVN